jgi:hypothetical protein
MTVVALLRRKFVRVSRERRPDEPRRNENRG